MVFLNEYLEAPKVLEKKLRETPYFLDMTAKKKNISIDQVLTTLIGSHMCIGCLDTLKNILQFFCFFGILGIIW
jgi:hypothetical protein